MAANISSNYSLQVLNEILASLKQNKYTDEALNVYVVNSSSGISQFVTVTAIERYSLSGNYIEATTSSTANQVTPITTNTTPVKHVQITNNSSSSVVYVSPDESPNMPLYPSGIFIYDCDDNEQIPLSSFYVKSPNTNVPITLHYQT